MKILGIDVGTTCCKCQIFDEQGHILFYRSYDSGLKNIDGFNFVDIDKTKENLIKLIKSASGEFDGDIDSIAFSSLGEAFVLLDEKDNVLWYPMLYTDPRGSEQADKIAELFGDRAYSITGVTPNAMFSVSKLLWIKDNHPEVFAKADKLLLVGEYLGYLLTGKRVIDYALASRTGIFDIRKKKFSDEMLEKLNIPLSLFSTPMEAGSVVSTISPEVCKELGLKESCVLVLGSHDQVCATVGAGMIHSGDAQDGMGTVGCTTIIFDSAPDKTELGKMGYSITPFIDGKYCTYIVNYSLGSLVNWFRKDILHGYTGNESNFFTYAEKHFSDNPTDIYVLPYFGGASSPYLDNKAKGSIVNVDLYTKDYEIYQAILECTSLEVRLNLDIISKFGISTKNAVATGGGSNSVKWLQIKSDATGISYKTLRSSEGGLCGLAVISAKALGLTETYEQAVDIFVKYANDIVPNDNKKSLYDKKYDKYKNLYKSLKEFN